MIRYATNLNIGDIVKIIVGRGHWKRPFQTPDGLKYVRAAGTRLMCFRESVVCAKCGLVGKYFTLEANNENDNPCFELYAVNEKGKEVRMMRDYKVPPSIGGKALYNMQTLCEPCYMLRLHPVPPTLAILVPEEGE